MKGELGFSLLWNMIGVVLGYNLAEKQGRNVKLWAVVGWF